VSLCVVVERLLLGRGYGEACLFLDLVGLGAVEDSWRILREWRELRDHRGGRVVGPVWVVAVVGWLAVGVAAIEVAGLGKGAVDGCMKAAFVAYFEVGCVEEQDFGCIVVPGIVDCMAAVGMDPVEELQD
jgi:hypothetical protein